MIIALGKSNAHTKLLQAHHVKNLTCQPSIDIFYKCLSMGGNSMVLNERILNETRVCPGFKLPE